MASCDAIPSKLTVHPSPDTPWSGGNAMLPDLLVPYPTSFSPLTCFVTSLEPRINNDCPTDCITFGPIFIRYLKTHQVEGQPIRDDGPITFVNEASNQPWGVIDSDCFFSIDLVVAVQSLSLACINDCTQLGAIGSLDDWMKLQNDRITVCRLE